MSSHREGTCITRVAAISHVARLGMQPRPDYPWGMQQKPMPLPSSGLETRPLVPGHNDGSATGLLLGLPSRSRV